MWKLCFDTLVIAVQLTITFKSLTHAQYLMFSFSYICWFLSFIIFVWKNKSV